MSPACPSPRWTRKATSTSTPSRAGFAARAVWRFVLVTLSYARRDVVRPVLGRHRPNVEQVRRRLGSLAGYLRLLPAALAERRRVRRGATVGDDELLARMVRR